MPVALGFRFSTDLVTARTHNKIMRTVNRETGEHIATKVTKKKFQKSALREYPGIVTPRGEKYNRRKQRKVGHTIPNVLSGRMREHVTSNSRVTATRNGGRVMLRNYFPMQARQRQELEAMNQGDVARAQVHANNVWLREANKPKNRRKRKRRIG